MRLAQEARIPYPTLRDIEAGISFGLEENKVAIAHALGVPMSELYAEAKPPPEPPPQEYDKNQQAAEILLELRILLETYAEAPEERRLLMLYLTTDEESYLNQYMEHPCGDRKVAEVLRRSL